jgi:carbon monoxide dehydrogenase subunit G
MQLNHRRVVLVPIESVWSVFSSVERLAECFPGASVQSVAGDDFTGSVSVKLGPVILAYDGSGTYVKRDPTTRRVVITAGARNRRGDGSVDCSIAVKLVETGPGTEVVLDTRLTLTGAPARFGSAVVQRASDQLVEQLLSNIAAKSAAGPGPDAAQSGLGGTPASAGPRRRAEVSSPLTAARFVPVVVAAMLLLRLLWRMIHRRRSADHP